MTATMMMEEEKGMVENGPQLSNSALLSNLEAIFWARAEIKHLFLSFGKVFGNMQSHVTFCYQDADIGDSSPVKQHPYKYKSY